jgi:DNA replication protein
MTKTTDQLVRIALSSGGMIFDGKTKTTDQLVRIASASSKSSAKIIITNINSKTTDQLIRIASAGKGNVIFDLR